MPPRPLRARTGAPRLLATIAALPLVLALALTGCGSNDSDGASPEPTGSASLRITASCDDLLPPDRLSAAVPHLTLDGAYAAPEHSLEAGLAAGGGVLCHYLDPGTKKTMTVAVARLPREQIRTLRDRLIVQQTPVPTYLGFEAYFGRTESDSVVQAFTDDLFIVARSDLFIEPGEYTELMRLLGETATAATGTQLIRFDDQAPTATPAPSR